MSGLDLREMDFSSLEEINIPVTLPDKSKWWLRRASSGAATEYRNAQVKCSIFGVEGNLEKADGIVTAELILLSLCLWDNQVGGNTMSLAQVKLITFPVQKKLVKRLKEISELTEDDQSSMETLIKQRDKLNAKIAERQAEEVELKNSQATSPPGS